MKKIDKSIEIVRSDIPGFSSISKKSAGGIARSLLKKYKTVNIVSINNLNDLVNLVERKPDLVFNGIYYLPNPDKVNANDQKWIWVAQYLDDNDIAYTGSTSEAHIISKSKYMSKLRVSAAGLKTSESYLIKPGSSDLTSERFGSFPLFVKPCGRKGGAGIDSDSVVHNLTQLKSKVIALHNKYKSDVLVEHYLEGREFTVAVFNFDDNKDLSLFPIEQLPEKNSNGDRIIGHEMKSAKAETKIALIDDLGIKNSVMKLAKEAFIVLGGRDYGRIDIRMDKDNTPHFLESNLIPGFIEGSGNFPKSCDLNAGIKFDDMIYRIVDLGLQRAELNNPQKMRATQELLATVS